MNYKKILLLSLWILGVKTITIGQNPPLSFHHLTVEDGLNDGHIQMIGQDKFGYMWFGSLGALNRYDGRQIKNYAYRAGDSTSPLSGMAFSMVTDSSGRLFFGFTNGFAEFDFLKNQFKRIESLQGLLIYRMIAVDKNRLFLITEQGLVKYDPLSNQAHFYAQTDSLLKTSLREGVLKGNDLYICTEKGLIIFDWTTEKTRKPPLSINASPIAHLSMNSLAFDEHNRLWVTTDSKPKIVRFAADFQTYDVFDRPLLPFDPLLSREYFILRDKKNRIWITTKTIGLLQYLPETNSLVRHTHDSKKPWTSSANMHMSIFADKDGIVWLGGNEGINYFHPDKNLFEPLLPFDTELDVRNRRWARSVTEDKDKNLWFGTVDGVVGYDIQTKTYQEWRNEPNKPPVIIYNSIRDIFCDAQNNIWVVTSKGLNRYNRKTGQMDAMGTEKGFPPVSYMRMAQDRAGNMWFITLTGDGYYQYNPTTQTLQGISQHPQLKRFSGLMGWSFLQDSKGRYWLGMDETGLGMYDPTTGQTHHWKSEGRNAIAGNIVMDIKEDHNGKIWIATNHGVTAIDFDKNSFKTYNTDNGLGSNSTSALAVDALNRVWVGTGKGLMMLDSSRQSFTNFGLQDGLPSLAFTEFKGNTLSNGDIMMPTQKGYIRFNPLNYVTENRQLDCYITSFTVSNVETSLYPVDEKASVKAFFDADENSFSLNLVALNYFNPSQTWYAYKLEGIDANWHITQDPKAVYTNLSGGNYTFRYKASLNVNDWAVTEKSLPIHINTVFYKSYWFWGLLLASLSALLYRYYRNRNVQKKRMESLQNKAHLLEKEKAIMQYEGLKQQLNPHFLFNSLTSLSSLIQIDPKIANDFLESLSKTYRYILKSSESETVLLSDEIKFAENFVKLQKTRFENGLIVNFNIKKEDVHHKIVPVTLQNLIENAMKHNIVDEESPLVIDIFSENMEKRHPDKSGTEGVTFLIVRNNLQKKNFVATSNKQGLTNLVNLYGYLSNTPIDIKETSEFFTIKIPLL